jgi:hypothetical protein
MLESFNRVFDYSDFENKLRHYFSDSSTIYANIEMHLKEVRITSEGNLTVQVVIDDRVGLKENIGKIIQCCELSLYPKMLDCSEKFIELTDDQKKELLFQGFTLDQIHEKQIQKVKKIWNRFVITRFNITKNSIDYKEESTGKLFRAHLNRPLIMCRDNLLRLAKGGQDGMRELYQFVLDNSEIEELADAVPENTD